MKMRKLLSALLVLMLMLPSAASAVVSVPEGSWSSVKEEPVTITWFMAYDWFGTTYDTVNNIGAKTVQLDTGVTIEFSSGDTDKLNMLITTGSLPDVITMDTTATQRKLLEDAGALAPLEPLIAEYAPDMNIPQSMLDWYRNDDGQAYIIASFFYADERMGPPFGGMYVTHNKNFARKDILEQIDMTYDDLQTKDGMLKALRAVKEKNITYNGKPVTPWGSLDMEMLATQFGWIPEKKDGTLNSLYRSPEYKEALLWARQLYAEGLMNDEVFTWNNQQRDEAVANGSVFAGVGWTNIHREARRALYAADHNAQMLFAGRMDQDEEEKIHYQGINCAGWTATMINANAKNKDRIIKLFSYFTSDVATLNANYGTGTYDIVDGHLMRLPEVQAEFDADPTAASAKYIFGFSYFMDWAIIQKYWPQTSYDNPVEQDIDEAEMERDVSLYDGKCFTGLDPDAGTDLAATKTIIDDLWKQLEPQMIMAATPEACEALLEQALSETDALGQELIDAYRNEKFAQNKAKLGLEFAHPANQKK